MRQHHTVMNQQYQRPYVYAILTALLRRLARSIMRHVTALLIIALCAAVTLVAFLAQHDYGWLITGFSYMLGAVGFAAAVRERKAERQQTGDSAIDHLFDAALSARQKQSEYQAPRDSSETE
jgi:peptidoglycan/LPS O-acetylase OafA/YrhL